jgi:Pectate lyase superfamily protein
MKRLTFAVVAILVIGITCVRQELLAQSGTYELPNDDSACPNCRQIPWKAGSDLWNGGALPNYAGTTCTGLAEGNGTSDNTAAINSCISARSEGQAAVIPPGMYYVSGRINLKSGVVLRGSGGGPGAQGVWINSSEGGSYSGDVGSGSTVTTLKFGAGGGISTPGTGSSLGSAVGLSSGYTKGSQTLVTSSSPGMAVGDWIIVSENQGDSDIPTSWAGGDGNCTWCGEANNTGYLMTQIVQVTSVSGNNVGISRPMYYTFKASLNPRIRKLTNLTVKAGIESMKAWGSTNARTGPHINLDGCVYCWVKGVETYNTPDVAKAYPVYMRYSYGVEIRDSYFHYGQGNGGDRNYGIGMFGPNSDHKVENNILRQNRHGWSQEGGGSGNVFLYNYVDDQYTDDPSFLASPRANHGAHPYMTLFEGNIVSHFGSDYFWGTSSHAVLFRNWFWGDATGKYSGFTSSTPSWGFVALEIDRMQHYYSAVGNVLGNPNLHTNWANATLLSSNCSWGSGRSNPTVYGFGCLSQGGTFDAAVRSTMILHGNYDYKTKGVANWDGGSNHTVKASMYYGSKPAFFGSCAWPVFGPDLNPITNTLPAKARFDGTSACTASGPAPPTNFTTAVQ